MRAKPTAILGATLNLVFGGFASAEILDYGPWEPNVGEIGGADGADVFAQGFTAPAENVLVVAGMYLYHGGAEPPAVRVDIWAADADGNPDENNILVEGPLYQQYFPRLTRVTIEPENLALTPGELYYVVLNGMIDQESPGNYLSTYSAPDDPYPDGRARVSTNMGQTWTAGWNGEDFGFYIETVAEGCPGDVDGDGETDLSDLAAFLRAYGASEGNPSYEPNADFDGDGEIDLSDLAFLLANYGCGA